MAHRADAADRRRKSSLTPLVTIPEPICDEPRIAHIPSIQIKSDINQSPSLLSPKCSSAGRTPRKFSKINDMKPRETIVRSFVEEAPVPATHCCCGSVRVESGCRTVAILSMIGMSTNAILYFFGLSRLGLSTYLELLIIIFDFIAVVCLFMGISNKRSSMLKPYLIFMTLWTAALVLLFMSCLWNIFRSSEFPRNLFQNVYGLKGEPDPHRLRHVRHGDDSAHFFVTTIIMLALGVVIFIDGLFVHVVYRGFQYFSYNEDKEREEEENKSMRPNSSLITAT